MSVCVSDLSIETSSAGYVEEYMSLVMHYIQISKEERANQPHCRSLGNGITLVTQCCVIEGVSSPPKSLKG